MKKMLALLIVSALGLRADAETLSLTLTQDLSSVRLVDTGVDGYVALECPGLEPILEPVGAPQLSATSVTAELPAGATFVGATYEAEWKTLGENVKLSPVQPLVPFNEDGTLEVAPFAEPDAALYASYPEKVIETFGVQKMSGKAIVPVRVIPFRFANGKLEVATKFVVKVEYTPKVTSRLKLAINPSHEVAAGEGYVKPAGSDQPDYILIAPKNYFSLWKWYVDERQKDHPEKVMKAVNFADILAKFPVNTDDPDAGYYARNDAERLHAYIREQAKLGTHYFVLAGSWYDAHGCPKDMHVTETRKHLQVTTPQAQYQTNADWGIPGIYTIPRSDLGSWYGASFKPVPSDLFYACCDLPDGAKYPWDYGSFDKADPEGDGIYCNEPDDRIDLFPDVVVSRIGFICGLDWREDRYNWTMEKLVKAYLAKVRRVEAKDFAGRNRFAGGSHTFTQERGISDGSLIRDEMEFYAGQNNYFDKNASSIWMDCDYAVSLLLKDWYTRYFPALKTEHVSALLTPPGEKDFESAVRNLHEQDWEVSMVASHGSQGGSASMVYINEYAQKMRGISKVFLAYFPCLMAYPDWTPNQNDSGIHKITHNMSLIENPDGGAAFACGNTRSSWGGGIIRRDASHGDGLGMKRGGFFVKAYARDHLNPGDAWLKMIQNYWGANIGWSTGRWVLVEDMAMGDPMIETHGPEDHTWVGAQSGEAIWDLKEKTWSRLDEHTGVSSTTNYEHAAAAKITATDDLMLSVASTLGAIRLEVNQPAGSTFKLTGEGTVRVATNMVVSAGNVTFGVGGGVGHDGLKFTGEKGNIRFEGNRKFYLAKIKNGGTVTFAGSNGLLDLRNFSYSFIQNSNNTVTTDRVDEKTVEITGIEFEGEGKGNTIRSDDPGVLTKYLPETIENQEFRLETYDGFNGAKAENKRLTVKNGRMTVSSNPNLGLAEAKCREVIDIPLTLDDSTLEVERVSTFSLGRDASSEQTLTVCGNSKITSAMSGRIGLYGTTTVNLEVDSKLTISAPFDNKGNGKLVFRGSGELIVENAAALVGDVDIGGGLTVTFKSLPFPNLKNLTIGNDVKVVLPSNASGTYQITPLVGSVLKVGERVVFYNGSISNPIDGCVANQNGSVFDPLTVLSWLGQKNASWNDDNWVKGTGTASFNSNNGTLFGDKANTIPVTRKNIEIGGEYVAKFAQFANTSPYTFSGTTANSALAFGAMTVGGDVTFNELQLRVSGAINAMNGKLTADKVNTEEVHVYDGATYGANRTDFKLDKIRYVRVFFLEHLETDTSSSVVINDHRVRMEELYLNYLDENGTRQILRGGTKSLHGGWLVTGNLGLLFDGNAAHTSAYRYGQTSSVEIGASKEDMADGKVYIEIDIGSTIPVLNSFGVHSSKKNYQDGSSTHAYRPVKFRIDASYDGVTYYTIMSDTRKTELGGDMPQYYGGWVGGGETSFPCNKVNAHPTAVEILSGGALGAMGAMNGAITLEEGAIVKAVPGEQLTASADTTWMFPSEGKVTVDANDLELTDNPIVILEDAKNFSFDTLYRFEPSEGASLRYLEGGKIAVVSGDNMNGPYERVFKGSEDWSGSVEGCWVDESESEEKKTPGWKSQGAAFEKPWSDYKLDVATDVIIDLLGDATVTVDCDVEIDTIRACETSNLAGHSLTILPKDNHKIVAQALNFQGFDGEVTYGLDCGSSRVIAGPSLKLLESGTGILEVPNGSMVILTKPWKGEIIGTGVIALDPYGADDWRTVDPDFSMLSTNTTSTVRTNAGVMTLPEGTKITAPKFVVGSGSKVITTPTETTWVLTGKNVEVEAGGELVIKTTETNWQNGLNFAKVTGVGSIVYENKSETAISTVGSNIPAPTLTMDFRGPFTFTSATEGAIALDAAKIRVSEGGIFSASKIANSNGQFNFIRISFKDTNYQMQLVEFAALHNGNAQRMSGSVECAGGSALNYLINDPNPNFFPLQFQSDQITKIPANGTVLIKLNNPILNFSNYRFGVADKSKYPKGWDIEISEDGQTFFLVSSVRGVTVSGSWNWGATYSASRAADMTVAAGGTLLAKGALDANITFEAGAVVKPVDGQAITLSQYSVLTMPREGSILVDVSDITITRGQSINFISGYRFTEEEAARFVTNRQGYGVILSDNGSLKLEYRGAAVPKVLFR